MGGGGGDTKSCRPHCVCILPALSQNAACCFPVCPGTASHGSWRPLSPIPPFQEWQQWIRGAETLPVSKISSTSHLHGPARRSPFDLFVIFAQGYKHTHTHCTCRHMTQEDRGGKTDINPGLGIDLQYFYGTNQTVSILSRITKQLVIQYLLPGL